MKRLVVGLVVATLLAAGVFVFWFFEPWPHDYFCDGTFPVWMLEVQDYNGGGCAEMLPRWQAPSDADWRLYCTGMCDPRSNPSGVSFPQAADR